MKAKHIASKRVRCALFVLPVVLVSFGVCLAQQGSPKSEAELRVLIRDWRSRDPKRSDPAREALSKAKLDLRDIPTLIRIAKKGSTCERAGAAEIIVLDLDRKNRDVIPALVELATGRGVFSSENDLLCRRAAIFLLAWSSDGIRILTGLLNNWDVFVRQSAMFAFYEHTEGSNFPDDSVQAWKEAIPFIVAASRKKDKIVSGLASEVLDRFIGKGGQELSDATKNAMERAVPE